MLPTLFLPGAVGEASFWSPVAAELKGETRLLSLPGLGNQPHEETLDTFDAHVFRLIAMCDAPVNVVAQSMGGYIALIAALTETSQINRLVLVATSGGINLRRFGGVDWRNDYRTSYPNAAGWIEYETVDLSERLRNLDIPILLIWGDSDPISPMAVGEYLYSLLPNASLQIIKDGDHDVAQTHVQEVSKLIANHLQCDIQRI